MKEARKDISVVKLLSKMNSDTVLDYAVFQLSPKHSRCELFVSSNGQTEKLASELIEKLASHLKVVEEQAVQAVHSSIRLEVDKSKHAEVWFTKGTLERFLQFVSTPEALEMVNTFDAEMSQLEAARKLYSQGNGDGTATATSDATKKELLRAIDLRLDAVRRDLTMAFNHAAAAGFNPGTLSDLQQLADRFDAHRLDEACTKFILVCQRRPELVTSWKPSFNHPAVRSSWPFDMSIDEPSEQSNTTPTRHQINQLKHAMSKQSLSYAQFATQQQHKQNEKNQEENLDKKDESPNESSTSQASQQPGRRLSVQDRINLFESKQKESSNSGGKPVPVGRSTELRGLSSDVSSGPAFVEKYVLRRWSGVSDMSIDLGCDKKLDGSTDSPLCTPSSSAVSQARSSLPSRQSDVKDQNDQKGLNDTVSSLETDLKCGFVNASNNTSFKSQNSSEVGNAKIDGEFNNRTGDVESTNQRITQSVVGVPKSPTCSFSAQTEGDFGIKTRYCQYKGIEGDQLDSQPFWRSFTKGSGKVGKKDSASSEKQPSLTEIPRVKVPKPASAVAGAEEIQKSQGRRDYIDWESQENSAMIPTSVDQVQRIRESKGNQGLNDELKMKANELEKLFAEHKLRAPRDQSSSSRRSKHGKTQNEQKESKASAEQFPDKSTMIHSSGSSSDLAKFSTPQTGKMLGNHDYGDILRCNFSDVSFSNDSRGKFYDKYMEKRDTKLREEWTLKSAKKEAKLKAMQDALGRSRVEMKAKFSCSSERKDSLSNAHQHAEKFRSFNSRSSMKNDQHPISSFQSDEDEDLSEYSDQKYHGKDRQSNGLSVGDSAFRSSQARKLHPNKSMSSATSRTIASPIPLSSAKVSSTVSARRRGQSNRVLAQSVPNFLDLRKENTKPSSGVGKAATRSQVRNTARSKVINEDMPPVRKEKPQRPQSLKKSSSWNMESTELSTLDPDGVLAPLKLDKEQSEREGNSDVDPDTGSDISDLRATENMKIEEYGEPGFEGEDLETKREEEEQEVIDETMAVEDTDAMDDKKPKLSGGNSRTENGDSLQPISQVDPSSIPDLPATLPSTFHSVASLLDSPGESPIAWNSRLHHPFSYPHEASDIDASVDSPVGSPASWNSRMRKKWGSAQNPVMVTNSSQCQPRMDVTKGIKRFLRFGRKNRGADCLMDWVSVTTSEGDDDTDDGPDGRDIGNRSSEDLRKSRMGFMRGHPSDDGFNENELFDEQVHAPSSSLPALSANFKLKDDNISGSSIKAPRSFFSLSNFRSKGSDSNPR